MDEDTKVNDSPSSRASSDVFVGAGQRSIVPERRIGLIGLGSIGRDVVGTLRTEGFPAEIIALTRRRMSNADIWRWVGRTDELVAARPDLVIEAAGHGAVAEHVAPLLRAGIPVVVVSVGALADDALRLEVTRAAQIGKTSVIFPSGAIGALDYIRTVSHSANLSIRYCSRKPVAAWQDELIARGFSPDKVDREIVLFEGSAREAALSFPQNLNVAMSLALAGPGIESVQVRVVADPRAAGNTHEIDIASAAGHAVLVFNNMPSADNPKTSALTALSIVHAVREHFVMLDAAR
ncbi:MAG: aspartate dehydrogenase [Opitutaceae bacterium]